MSINTDDLWLVLDLYRSWSAEYPMPCPVNRGGLGDRVQPTPGALPMPWRYLIEVGKALAALEPNEYSTLMLYHEVRLAMLRASDRTGNDARREAQDHRRALDRMRKTETYRNAVARASDLVPAWAVTVANPPDSDTQCAAAVGQC